MQTTGGAGEVVALSSMGSGDVLEAKTSKIVLGWLHLCDTWRGEGGWGAGQYVELS